jgi:hypothetical protein
MTSHGVVADPVVPVLLPIKRPEMTMVLKPEPVERRFDLEESFSRPEPFKKENMKSINVEILSGRAHWGSFRPYI